MNVLRTLLFSILTLSAVTFCALFGSLPRFRKTPIGYINRLIWVKIPGTFITIDAQLTGGHSSSWLKRMGNWLMNENHPIVLIFYMTLLIGGEITFLQAIWPHISSFQRSLVLILVTLPYVLTYLTVTTQSSVITPENHHEEMRRYPYDYANYYPGLYCRTCKHLKPARSKHCRVCNVCVAKQDHHCLWVKTCLGQGNYHYFLAMCASLGMLLSYGSYLAYSVLSTWLQTRYDTQRPGAGMPWSTGMSFGDKLNAFGWSFIWDVRIGAVGLLACFTAPLAWGLTLYHVYLIWVGVTTNESFKWDDWKADIYDGYVYLGQEPRDEAERQEAPFVRWPKRPTQKLLNRADETSVQFAGTPPSLAEPEWTRVKSLRELDNIYDLGFWENLRDIFPSRV